MKLFDFENYDVVICNSEFGYAVNHPRAINVLHGGCSAYARAFQSFVSDDLTRKRLRNAEIGKVSAQGKYVVVVSNFAKEMVGEDGIEVNEIIPLSVDTSVFNPNGSATPSRVFLAASLDKYYEKGFDRLEMLAGRGLKIRLFGGSGVQAPSLDVRDHVSGSVLKEEYNKASVFLNPTRFEPAGLTTLEAMACGCPVLTTPTGYGYDIQDTIPNFVVEDSDDIDEWLEKAKRLALYRGKYSKEALNYFRRFHDPEEFKRRWISLVEGL